MTESSEISVQSSISEEEEECGVDAGDGRLLVRDHVDSHDVGAPLELPFTPYGVVRSTSRPCLRVEDAHPFRPCSSRTFNVA